MALTRPTLSELISRTETRAVGAMTGLSGLLRRSVIRILSRVFAGLAHELYGYIEALSKEMLVSTAQTVEWLQYHATKWSINRKTATYATGTVVFTGSDGSVIPAGAELQNLDGDLYTTDNEATIAAGSASVNITASDVGTDGNMSDSAGTITLALVSPISNVDNDATVTGSITGGNDVEDKEDWRKRILERMQNPPMGGNISDYEKWVKDVPTVQATRVWPIPEYTGPSTVGIFFVLDNADPIIPDASTVQTVQEYLSGWAATGNTTSGSPIISSIADTAGIDVGDRVRVSAGFASADRLMKVLSKNASSITVDENAASTQSGASIAGANGLAPATDRPTVYAANGRNVHFAIALNPNTTAVQTAVNEMLAELFLREGKVGGTLLLSHIREAVSLATSEQDHSITEIYVDGVAHGVSNLVFSDGDLPLLDSASNVWSAL